MWLKMIGSLVLALCLISSASTLARADDATLCQNVRLASVGWSDLNATNALASVVLHALGYQPSVVEQSLPETFKALSDGNLEVFLGNWMPAQTNVSEPFLKSGKVKALGVNLDGAKYTLAVPSYLAAQGLKDFRDLPRFSKELGGRIYGIEPGNDGNRLVQEMIRTNRFGLKDFHLVESSESGMLVFATKAIRAKQPVVFLAWAPHPMNTSFDLSYLSGGDDFFGPNYGGATVYTLANANLAQQCPNLAQLLGNLRFSVDMENQLMTQILDFGRRPEQAAADWLRTNPQVLSQWLTGVKSLKGDANAFELVRRVLDMGSV